MCSIEKLNVDRDLKQKCGSVHELMEIRGTENHGVNGVLPSNAVSALCGNKIWACCVADFLYIILFSQLDSFFLHTSSDSLPNTPEGFGLMFTFHRPVWDFSWWVISQVGQPFFFQTTHSAASFFISCKQEIQRWRRLIFVTITAPFVLNMLRAKLLCESMCLVEI